MRKYPIQWIAFEEGTPDPDTYVLMWDQRGIENGHGVGYTICDFDHDSDAKWWLDRGYTHWAYLSEPDLAERV